MDQSELARINQIAWSSDSYAAWVNLYGTPTEAANTLRDNPTHKVRRLIDHLPTIENLKIANPLGSHGRIATALALLGADVTVFDISESNAQYGLELSESAGVNVDYVIGDFQLTAKTRKDQFDVVVMDYGVVHYFLNLAQFVAAVRSLVPIDGMVVLNEFHPLVRKSISVASGSISLSGDYFLSKPEQAPVPFEEFVNEDIPACLIRRWNLGEIITAFAAGGFRIQQLVEHPLPELVQIPGSFTLIATAD